jgi:hypothetical protein
MGECNEPGCRLEQGHSGLHRGNLVEARARLDWEAALRNLRTVASPPYRSEQLDAAFDQLVDAVEEMCAEAAHLGEVAIWEHLHGAHRLSAREIARRLVRGKDEVSS